jgi:hypothetical protein
MDHIGVSQGRPSGAEWCSYRAAVLRAVLTRFDVAHRTRLRCCRTAAAARPRRFDGHEVRLAAFGSTLDTGHSGGATFGSRWGTSRNSWGVRAGTGVAAGRGNRTRHWASATAEKAKRVENDALSSCSQRTPRIRTWESTRIRNA